jgi:hypothetical protein
LLVSIHALEPRGDKETNNRVSPKVVETHDKKIIKELYNLGRELEKIEVRKAVEGAGFYRVAGDELLTRSPVSGSITQEICGP